MTESERGVRALIAAATIFGLASLLFHQLSHVPPMELLAHRILWSFVTLVIVILLGKRRDEVRAAWAARDRRGIYVAAAALLGLVWLLFIHAVTTGQAIEASLGFYTMPLIAVGLAFAFLGERFTFWQYAGLALAVVAVAVLMAGSGRLPVLALAVGFGLAFYGFLVRRLKSTATAVFFVETSVLMGPALIWLIGAHAFGWTDATGREGGAFGSDLKTTALMILSGPLVTVLPMILFNHGTQHTNFATSGLIFYINPTLQFLVALLVFGEALTRWQEVAFPLLWIGLLIYSVDSLRRQRGRKNSDPPPSPALHPFHPGRM